ncbi:surfeit locus protein 5 subunit 22 of mediator complex-domain-containing protein [Sphaerosporella brunnea]|uniref:Surfeit locus protein 5 subunit 22 of mediator complex-domain-containing protein n=1 Tax=Sphaerosporella brunnea TaxID=1250544 RepID=A0A5J5EZB1_9PEZI|nr:surfeit locus protein 5 subunit 22 of mediator complex-domain-containing protein [Sphaerosporella brunnea]
MSYDPNAGYRALQGRVTENLDTLLKRFEAISQLAPVRKPSEANPTQMDEKDRTQAAAEAYQIETHASSMIRAAEDLSALTRSLKEAWLFGQLGSGFEAGATQSDEDARIVGEMFKDATVKAVKVGGEEEGGAEKR